MLDHLAALLGPSTDKALETQLSNLLQNMAAFWPYFRLK